MVAQLLKDKGEAAAMVYVRKFFADLLPAASPFEVQLVGFDREEPAESPACYDHDFDQVGFDAVLGLETVHVVGEEEVEVLGGFFRKEDGFGVEAMFAAVGRAAGFSFLGDGAVGFGSVDSRRFAFKFSRHMVTLRLEASGWVAVLRCLRVGTG